MKLPLDIILNIGSYVEDPETYFRLRHICRALYRGMRSVVPVSIQFFLDRFSDWKVPPGWYPEEWKSHAIDWEVMSGLHEHVELVGSASDYELGELLNAVRADRSALHHVVSALFYSSSSQLRRMRRPQLLRLWESALLGLGRTKSLSPVQLRSLPGSHG